MRRAIALLIIITMIVSPVVCRKNKNTDSNDGTVTIEPVVNPEEPQTIEEDCKRISVSLSRKHDSITDMNGREVVSIDYDAASVLIDDEPVEYFGKALQEKADSFLKFFYDADAEEISQIGSDYKYKADFKIFPQRMDEKVMSFVMAEHSNTIEDGQNDSRLAVCFDVEKECQLKLKDLTEDYASLEKFLYEYVLKLMSENKFSGEFFDGYENSIGSVVTDGLWYFSDDGITFICNADIIAPYDAGIMEFTVPYEELSGYIDKKFLPKGHTGGAEDTTSVSIMSEYDASGYKVLKLDLDSDGRSFAITTDKTIYDVSLCSVTYDGDSEEFTVNRVLYKCSRLTRSELLEITADIHEEMPALQLTYKLVDGCTITNYISENEKDGSLLVSEL